MNLSSAQFGTYSPNETQEPRPLNKGVKKMYKQLSEQLNIELKQAQLAKQICYPWQLDCNADPEQRSSRNRYKIG